MIDLASIPAYLGKFCYELLREIGVYRGLQHTCEVRVYDKRGKLRAFRFVRQRLILNNFRNLLAGILSIEDAIGSAPYSRAFSAVNLVGTSRSPRAVGHADIGTGNNYGITFNAQSSYSTGRAGTGNYGTRIRIGTSTVAPTRADYALGSEVTHGVPSITVGTDFIAWSIGLTLATGAVITEAGLSLRMNVWFDGAWGDEDILMFRDVFPTPVDVPDGGTIAVTERVAL